MGQVRALVLGAAVGLVVTLGACGDDDGGPSIERDGLPSLAVTSPAFVAGGSIPAGYTCSGPNQAPALHWEGEPANTGAFALIVEDPDANTFTHWVVYDIPAGTHDLQPGASPGGSLPVGTNEGKNGFGKTGYGGPCPPKGDSPHRYRFDLYALDGPLGLAEGASKADVERAINAHVVAFGELVGTFGR